MTTHIVSADPGKRQDPAAIAVIKARYDVATPADYLERNKRIPAWREVSTEGGPKRIDRLSAEVIHLEERMDRSYKDLITRLDALIRALEHGDDRRLPVSADEIALLVDVTGVGDAVVDWMIEAGLRPVPILITTGYAISAPTGDDNRWHVPRTEIITAAQHWWEQKRVSYPPPEAMPLAAKLNDQLRGLKRVPRRGPGVDEVIESDEEHDDLAMCVGQGLWYLSRVDPMTRVTREVSEAGRRRKFDVLRGRRK